MLTDDNSFPRWVSSVLSWPGSHSDQYSVKKDRVFALWVKMKSSEVQAQSWKHIVKRNRKQSSALGKGKAGNFRWKRA